VKVIVTPQAEHDLDEIGAYIARDNRKAAVRILTVIRTRLRRLRKFPRAGQALGLLDHPDLRRIVFGNYLIVHALSRDAVIIVRILHGARDLETALRDTANQPDESE
jgi:toxin ParE1/3/4